MRQLPRLIYEQHVVRRVAVGRRAEVILLALQLARGAELVAGGDDDLRLDRDAGRLFGNCHVRANIGGEVVAGAVLDEDADAFLSERARELHGERVNLLVGESDDRDSLAARVAQRVGDEPAQRE